MSEPTTHTLDVPGAVLAYDIRRNDSSVEPPLFLIGSPMGAAGFATLSAYFTDRTLVTYDPRGSERSKKTPDAAPNSPELHADDLRRIISEVGGPVDLFASSGGAVNALALVAKHPEDVRILVAHEPPAFSVLPDREAILAATDDMRDTYLRDGFAAALAKFIPLSSHVGPIPDDWSAQPQMDPHLLGLPMDDDGTRDDPLFAQNMVATARFEPDYEALQRAPTRIIIAAGEESLGQMTGRSSAAIAQGLGIELVVFPGHHGGFFGGEYGQMGKPREFAEKLRDVLNGAVPALA